MLKKGLITLIAGAALALSPVSAVAEDHGGHGGEHGGGQAHGFHGGGFSHSRGFGEDHAFRGHEGHADHDYHFHGGYSYGGPGFSFGFYGAPYYGYAYPYGTAPCGYYDQFGNWITTACDVPPYGY